MKLLRVVVREDFSMERATVFLRDLRDTVSKIADEWREDGFAHVVLLAYLAQDPRRHTPSCPGARGREACRHERAEARAQPQVRHVYPIILAYLLFAFHGRIVVPRPNRSCCDDGWKTWAEVFLPYSCSLPLAAGSPERPFGLSQASSQGEALARRDDRQDTCCEYTLLRNSHTRLSLTFVV